MSNEKDELLKEIYNEEKIIAKLPTYTVQNYRAISSGRTSWQNRARHQTNMSKMKERLLLIGEEERIASVVHAHLELHPYMLEFECPICLDSIPITERGNVLFMSCCGGVFCGSCSMGMLERTKLTTCALCRGEYPSSNKVRADGIKRWAKKGNIFAQNLLAGLLYAGDNPAFPANKRQALKWARASKGHPHSLFLIGSMHGTGECGLEKSEEKVRSILKVCAEGGYKDGQEEYAAMSWWGKGGGVDRETALRYATLACRDGKTDVQENLTQAACTLGWLYQFGEGGVDKSIPLAKHYLQLSSDGGHSMAYFQLAELLINDGLAVYDGNISIPGFSPIPRALYWARKSVAEDEKEGMYVRKGTTAVKEFIQKLEVIVQKSCTNLDKGNSMQQFGEVTLLSKVKLMCCGRCQAAWYCSKTCQLQHWNAGHKDDCIKQKKKKAEN